MTRLLRTTILTALAGYAWRNRHSLMAAARQLSGTSNADAPSGGSRA